MASARRSRRESCPAVGTGNKRGRPMLQITKDFLQALTDGNFDFLGPVTPNNGFSRNRVPEKILFGFKRNENLLFVVKFKRIKDFEIVPGYEMKARAPALLIQYYADHLCVDPDADTDPQHKLEPCSSSQL
ncbi:hypothetical protein KR009_002358 [Drosophila setifemur]|nr:hypothetical protein KR009_002358 [Drosophila setifemur]